MSAPANPPAFPQPQFESFGHAVDPLDHDGHPGMTLRDWFAGQAISGFCANPEFLHWSPERFAETGYLVADAMLAERAKSGGAA